MKKSKSISVSDAVDRYYKRHKAELDMLFGNERMAKSQLKNMPNVPAYRFKNVSSSTKAFNSFVDTILDPAKQQLKEAKAEAMTNTPNVFRKSTQLNRRIDKNGYVQYQRDLGTSNGFKKSVIGYYEILNSNYVLAEVVYTGGKNTQLTSWEFIDKAEL